MPDSGNVPADLRYTAEHEWVDVSGEACRIGITDFAQNALGDVVFVSLPEVGADVAAGDSLGELESTKSVSELYAPIAGTVTGRNDALEATPELINTDPYGEGWILEITPADGASTTDATADLLDADAYSGLSA